ncbi:protein regulator of cytokinesis 1 isoform X1 [Anguilla anguilla]|uniref:protein regulator of cytokinesis 1 isoform X1 n=1 Tax=Anguilla anguilla TaxID=7936 RepID=UPI0015B0789A|nr:protein regulator of cytokinesis 1 isoform X1 [Anguilla anguilla]
MSSRRSEALAVSLVSGINMAMGRLVDIWDSIGIMEEQRVERMEAVKKHIESLLNDMITEEAALKQRIGSNITNFQTQLENLCLEMSLEPSKLEEGLTVLQKEKHLRLQVEALLKEKTERLKEVRGLQQEDEELCVELCATPYYIPTGSLPSRTQLEELRQHIQTLTQEKDSRVKVFAGLREDIGRMMQEMGHEPETSLEKEAVCNDDDVFLLTQENIKALKLLLCQLELKKKSLTSTRDELKGRAVSLWERLDVPELERAGFQEGLLGPLSEDVALWQREVDRLEVQQKARLGDVICKVRQELVHYWDKCMFGPAQREVFNSHFCDDSFTECLLSIHEAELQRVKACYEKARPLLENVDKWEKNWALFQDFERKASDPNRFSNRGGALLKEAKERVRVQKMLPKLEEELRIGVEDWEKIHGSPILVRGQKVMEYISSQWEEHRLQRGKEKNERMTKKGETTQTFKTPSKRPHGGISVGSTPNKIRKTPNQTMLRSTCPSTSGTPSAFISMSAKPPLSANKGQKSRALDSSHTPLQELNSEKKNLRIGSYSEFTSELSKKTNQDAILNSTAKDIF